MCEGRPPLRAPFCIAHQGFKTGGTNMQSLMLELTVKLHTWLRSERGQTLAEYGLIMAMISVFVVGGAGVLLKDQIDAAFRNAAQCLDGSC